MILQIALNSPLRICFDYLPPPGASLENLKPGVRVRVPFRNKTTVGILVNIAKQSRLNYGKLKQAMEILDEEPIFSKEIFELLNFASNYYQHPVGEVFAAALPTLLRKGAVIPGSAVMLSVARDRHLLAGDPSPQTAEAASEARQALPGIIKPHTPLSLNPEQQQAVESISEKSHQFGVYLLYGVTGSGKTEVYWRLIEKTLLAKKQVLILVPEIGLTPQLSQRLQEKLCVPIVVIHSTLTEKERLDAWIAAKNGAPIVIGTRSAIFTPLLRPGLIIVDEEHDLSLKQQEGFRYSARDIAIMRAQKENIPILLGSATPSLESLANVQKKRYNQLNLPKRAGVSVMPRFHVVDIRAKSLKHGLSSVLLDAIEKHLSLGRQVLLFINRRGYAPVLLCHRCGWIAVCSRCDARLTLHHGSASLTCHHCGFTRNIDHACPHCHSEDLLKIGLGTERVESILTKQFPGVMINRIDRDTTRRKGAMAEALASAKAGQSQILIGTQMITKGHHFPEVTLVGVLDADGGFFSSDFRATERMAQLLIQVAGRAGREEQPGEVYLQTHQPEHPLLLKLLQEGYESFANALLTERKLAQLPPFSYLALFRAEAAQSQEPHNFLQHVAFQAKKMMNTRINVLGPIPAPMQKRAGHYRAQLLLRSGERASLNDGLKQLLACLAEEKITHRVRWSLDVDPLEMF